MRSMTARLTLLAAILVSLALPAFASATAGPAEISTSLGKGVTYLKGLQVESGEIPGFGGDVTYGAGYVWTTLVGVPLTKIDASTNRIVAQWYGRGGDAIHFNYGTIWLADYDHHLVWRIKP